MSCIKGERSLIECQCCTAWRSIDYAYYYVLCCRTEVSDCYFYCINPNIFCQVGIAEAHYSGCDHQSCFCCIQGIDRSFSLSKDGYRISYRMRRVYYCRFYIFRCPCRMFLLKQCSHSGNMRCSH